MAIENSKVEVDVQISILKFLKILKNALPYDLKQLFVGKSRFY